MYSLIHNQAGHALAIVRDGYHVLHLDAGTIRNEENVQQVVDVLNAADMAVSHPAWIGVSDEDVDLERAVKRLRGEL